MKTKPSKVHQKTSKTLTGQAALQVGLACLAFAALSCGEDQPNPDGGTGTHQQLWQTDGAFTSSGSWRFRSGIQGTIAWGSPAIQTSKPISKGTGTIHFAHVGKEWATFVPAPTGLRNPSAISRDGSMVASSGHAGQVSASKPGEELRVFRIADGKALWSAQIREGVPLLKWSNESILWYVTNVNKLKLGPNQFVVRRVRPLKSKDEETIYSAPKGNAIWGLFPSRSGKLLLLGEQIAGTSKSQFYIYDVAKKERRVLGPIPDDFDTFNVYWWPDEASVYIEINDRPELVELATGQRKLLFDSAEVVPEGHLEGALSPSGDRYLYSHPKTGKLHILDLKTMKKQEILFTAPKRGPWLRNVAWSVNGKLIGGWVGAASSSKGSSASLTWYPMIIDVERKHIAVYRSSEYARPFFFVESKDVLEALRTRAATHKNK